MGDDDALRTALVATVLDEGWGQGWAERVADVGLRRWRSFERRVRPNRRGREDRIADLRQGIKQWLGDDILYTGPGDVERVARRLAAVLDPQ